MMGSLQHYNRHRLDFYKQEYYPYVKEGTSLYKMLRDTFKLKEPLLKDSHLVIINEEEKKDYKEFGKNIKLLVSKDLQYPHIDYLYIVSPKDTYGQLPDYPNLNLVDLGQTRYEDYRILLERELQLQGDTEIIPLLIKKIGYSEEQYEIYKELLLELKYLKGYLTVEDVKTLIPEKILPPINEILLGIINTNRKRDIKNH